MSDAMRSDMPKTCSEVAMYLRGIVDGAVRRGNPIIVQPDAAAILVRIVEEHARAEDTKNKPSEEEVWKQGAWDMARKYGDACGLSAEFQIEKRLQRVRARLLKRIQEAK